MIKEVVIGYSSNIDPIIADRYYLRYHGPDVVRISGPWLRRYESYRAYAPPPEAAERFGAKGGRYTELWFNNTEEYRARPKLITSSPPPWEGKTETHGSEQALLAVPALPTEEFLLKQIDPEKTTLLRWCQAIRYPEGVSVEEGEKWYLEVHSEEAKQQHGLLGYYSYLGLKGSFAPAMVPTKDGKQPKMPVAKPWVRVSELWYENLAAWRKAVIESPPEYTSPPWGGEYPFVEMISNFIDLKPDVDFLKGNYIIP